jgi:hypothetical protein
MPGCMRLESINPGGSHNFLRTTVIFNEKILLKNLEFIKVFFLYLSLKLLG